MDNKKNNLSTIIIVVLVIIILGMGIYIACDKGGILKTNQTEVNDKNSSNSNEVEEIEKKLSFDDASFNGVLSVLSEFIYDKSRENGYADFTSSDLVRIIGANIKESDVLRTSQKSQYDDYFYSLSGSKVDSILKELFGNEIVVDKRSIGSSGHSAPTQVDPDNMGSGMVVDSYLSDKDVFLLRFGGMGGTQPWTPVITKTVVVSAMEKNDEIVVTEKAIYLGDASESEEVEGKEVYKIYSDPQRKNLIDTKVYNTETIRNEKLSVNDYSDRAATITITFKKDSATGKYVFKNSVIR